MIIYEALKNDHDKVKALLNQLVNLSEDDDQTRSELVTMIRDELVPHSRAEEAVFYNTLREFKPTSDIAMHGYKEHMEAESLLRILQLKDIASLDWKDTALKLKEALEHHVEEEEGLMFEVAKKNFTEEEALMMGEAFERMKPEIKDETIIATTWEMVANLMPNRFTNAFRKSNTPKHL
ncbi:hemerythrin domain-containing protein [Bdellovibrio sp. SKB1291214]|uniref:hemerythrin domain-containing protein n=1 Tax=Bdellovibrio sp. SKB1291214 TaxID=1732569 RepID=UPI000B51BA1A|nr:hemerythrin domain-containing protein [Bdellovibrio sp. SKB1291214]UYL07700.1 hemerythrin domain-containing protein [Bdellovibrio sp. SKB1291214]